MTKYVSTLVARIADCTGQKFLNKMYERRFSLNTFIRNYEDLITAALNISDTDYGLQLMSVFNRETGRQAHREISRYVHNFVSGSMTLKEHTGVFMRENYKNTILMEEYDQIVKNFFFNDPLSGFVQRLRNYMLHKGMPDSTMFIRFDKDPNGNARLSSGVCYDVKSLLQWKDWGGPAKKYLQMQGDELPIESFATNYYEKVIAFHEKLEEKLFNYHIDDTKELERLTEELESCQNQIDNLQIDFDRDSTNASRISNLDKAANSNEQIDELAEDRDLGDNLLQLITKLNLSPRLPDPFKSQRPATAQITPDKIIGDPVFWLNSTEENRVLAIIFDNSEAFGFEEVGIAKIREIAAFFKNDLRCDYKVSEQSLEDSVIRWCQLRYRNKTQDSLHDFIERSILETVEDIEVWIPIAYLEVESEIDFKVAKIKPISTDLIDMLEERVKSWSPDQSNDIMKMFDRMRSKMCGLAAVVLSAKSDVSALSIEADLIAQNLTFMIRFFSPNADLMSSYSTIAPLGLDFVPKQNYFSVGKASFSLKESVNPERSKFWRISDIEYNKQLRKSFSYIVDLLDK